MKPLRSIIITGANRGIGLEMVKHFSGEDESFIVVATCRDPSSADQLQKLSSENTNIVIRQLDVSKEEQMVALHKWAEERFPDGIDMLINNAGVFHKFPENSMRQETCVPPDLMCETKESLLHTYTVNALSPVLLSKLMVPLLAKWAKITGKTSTILNMSSAMGSIEENESGGRYNYRMSKAALNIATKSLAIDLAPLNIACFSCHPGWVATSMGGPHAFIDAQTSVLGIMSCLSELTLKESGKFFRYDGKPIKY